MRVGLFWKLFLLQLLAAAAVLGGALAVTRLYTLRSFAEYMELRERERVQEIAGELADHYQGSNDLAESAQAVLRLRRRGQPPEPDERGPPPEPGRRGAGSRLPLQLQDLSGNYVAGVRRPLPPDEAYREPVVSAGRTVAYLAWPRHPRYPVHAEFSRKQERGYLIVGGVALALAAFFAAWITGLILRPIRQLSAAAGALARREFTTRLAVTRGDELGQLASEFNRLAEALAGYDTRQRQWLADIAHELRTPLTVLRGELEALLDGLRAATPAALRSLGDEVRRLAGLVDDLQLLSSAESGGLTLHREDADAGEIARAAAARFKERLAQRGFALYVDVADALPVQADVQRLEQVLANLLENVLRHAKPGAVTISARRAGDRVRIAVSDSGPGVDAESLPRLFDRLYRADAARSAGGSGLGLSISRSIVEAHGGTIVARRSAAGGLEVEIALP